MAAAATREIRIASKSLSPLANRQAGVAAKARHRARFDEPTLINNERWEQAGPAAEKSWRLEESGVAESNTVICRNATALSVRMTAFHPPEKSEDLMRMD